MGKTRSLVGLEVHVGGTRADVLDHETAEFKRRRLKSGPKATLDGLGRPCPVRASKGRLVRICGGHRGEMGRLRHAFATADLDQLLAQHRCGVGTEIVHPGDSRQWRFGLDELEKVVHGGPCLLRRDGLPRKDGLKEYLDEASGPPLQDIWRDISNLPRPRESDRDIRRRSRWRSWKRSSVRRRTRATSSSIRSVVAGRRSERRSGSVGDGLASISRIWRSASSSTV